MSENENEIPNTEEDIDFQGGMPPPHGMERFPGPPMRPGMRPMRPHDGPMGGPPIRPSPGRFPPPFGQGFPPNPNFRMGPPFGPPGNIPTPPTNTTLPKPPIFDKDGQAWLEACTGEGKVYYFNAKTRETKWERPDADKSQEEDKKDKENKNEGDEGEKETSNEKTEEEEEDKKTEQENQQDSPKKNFHPSNMPPPFGMQPMMRPPPGMPPPGFPPAFPGQGMPPPRFPPFPGFPMPPPDFLPKTIGDWTEHRLPDGRLYYHNNKTKESRWEKPKEFDTTPSDIEGQKKDKSREIESGLNKGGKQSSAKQEKGSENSQKKPVASRPIVGTGWHLVWTGDGRVFFFSPSTKTSIWERPKDLENNLTIDELLRMGPPSKDEKDSNLKTNSAEVSTSKEEPMDTAPSEPKIEVIEGPVRKKKKRNNNDDLRSLPILQEQQQQNHAQQKKEEDHTMKEAEVKKSIIPLDERMTMFTQLLREKQVSAFSTWEKELHKILFDPRYLLLTMKERKNCYEKYVRVRAVEERKERVQKLKEKKDEFKQLLEEVVSSVRLSFSDFAAKNSKDSRYKAIEKMRERETLFNEFMSDFKKHEKERLRAREDKLRKSFFELLGELNNLTVESEWKKVKGSIEADKRYDLVGSSSKRQQFFNEYIKQILTPNDEDKKEDEDGDQSKEKEEGESKDDDKPASPLNEEEEEERRLDAKYERMEASLRKREEEVRAQKELYEKDREKERGIHLHDKAVQHFNALLADMVRDTQYSWKETRRTLRKDPRWSALDVLDKATKETLFNEHIKEIHEKRKGSFRRLLEEADVPLDAYWREVRRHIKDDPRYGRFGTSELREEEFEQFIREKTTLARNEFRELLRETKIITYKSRKLMDDNPGHWKDIKEILKKDKRYLTMSTLADERDRLIQSYIDDLYKRGPPPPPTATNPAARYKKD